MIDWSAFLSVAIASLSAALIVVGSFALGLRLQASGSPDVAAGGARRVGSIACFVVCGAAILYGIYLIVPALHG